jgi:hypothetical protein
MLSDSHGLLVDQLKENKLPDEKNDNCIIDVHGRDDDFDSLLFGSDMSFCSLKSASNEDCRDAPLNVTSPSCKLLSSNDVLYSSPAKGHSGPYVYNHDAVDLSYFMKESSRKYFLYQKHGLGHSYLVSMSQYHRDNVIESLKKVEVDTQMMIALFVSELTFLQRHTFTDILQRTVKITTDSVSNVMNNVQDMTMLRY